jgi:DNA-directed RNA polymerase specialized sigma subunit
LRKLKIDPKTSTARDQEFENLIAVAKTKKLSNTEDTEFLHKIRSGNRESNEKLVDSWEAVILSVARQIRTDAPISLMLDAGKIELRKLAEQEVNSEARESFFRFGVWCVKQEMLKKINRDKSEENEQV